MHWRVAAHGAGMTDVNVATGIVFVIWKVELAGVAKSTWKRQYESASCVAPYGPPWSIDPT